MLTQAIGHLYTAVLLGLALYALHIVLLILLYLWHRRESTPPLPALVDTQLPTVTVQIPLRNERYVARRIIQAVAALDWPDDRLEIQILDDSDDITTTIVHKQSAELRRKGRDIYLLHRDHSQGHKAGALTAGLRQARGEFIAIFDADFHPRPDFLRQTVPYFTSDPKLGMVQARWTHLNAEYSLVTRIQALLLDAHFTVEHIGRNRSRLLINFNGTAGVWRRRAIEEAGGWTSDTIAEDLDLSYRAQLQGWQALYLPNVTAAAELPPLISAFKEQQYRWAKGATQSFRKLLIPLLRSPRLNFTQKVMGVLHLSGYFTQPLFLLLLLLTLPMTLLDPRLPELATTLGIIVSVPPALYLLGQMALYDDWLSRILYYPFLMFAGVGLAWTNTRAIIDGLLHWGGEFKRTPKFKLGKRRGRWRRQRYQPRIDRSLWGEILLGLYALGTLGSALRLNREDLLLLILIYVGGEMLIIGLTLFQAWTAQITEEA
ncbi:MAG: glycosyltransferase family 2 protein [Anaerolineae bacterium]